MLWTVFTYDLTPSRRDQLFDDSSISIESISRQKVKGNAKSHSRGETIRSSLLKLNHKSSKFKPYLYIRPFAVLRVAYTRTITHPFNRWGCYIKKGEHESPRLCK